MRSPQRFIAQLNQGFHPGVMPSIGLTWQNSWHHKVPSALSCVALEAPSNGVVAQVFLALHGLSNRAYPDPSSEPLVQLAENPSRIAPDYHCLGALISENGEDLVQKLYTFESSN